MEPDYRYPQPLFSSTGAYFWGFRGIFSPTQEILIAENGRIAPNAPIRGDSGHCRLLQFFIRISATVFS
jgi:hypothetical protein